jgi:phenylacetic acid degradation operon negative regulatory protein
MKKHNTLKYIFELVRQKGRSTPLAYDAPYSLGKKLKHFAFSKKYYGETINRWKKEGKIQIVQKNGQKFLLLTEKGELALLLSKATAIEQEKWDGKWRLISYDIPEEAKHKRQLFRLLLKRSGFVKLQASVFICPYALNSDAVEYLNETGLIDYIRIMRVDKMDKDEDLRKSFNLLEN